MRFLDARPLGLCHKIPAWRLLEGNPGGFACDLRLCLSRLRSDSGRVRWGRRPCSPAGPLPAKGLSFCLGEQPEGCLKPVDPEEKTPSNPEKTMGRIALVPQLFCRKLWGSPHRSDSPVYRTAEDATLKATTGTAMPSALSFPALMGEVCRVIGSRVSFAKK